MGRLRSAFKRSRGFALMELMIAALLFSVIFLASTSSYVSGLRLLDSARAYLPLDPRLAVDAMAKKINLANRIDTRPNDQELTLRLDYTRDGDGNLTPRRTASFLDDMHIKYAFKDRKLFYKEIPAGMNPDRVSPDEELVPGLTVTKGKFELIRPADPALKNPILVGLEIESGNRKTKTAVVADAASNG